MDVSELSTWTEDDDFKKKKGKKLPGKTRIPRSPCCPVLLNALIKYKKRLNLGKRAHKMNWFDEKELDFGLSKKKVFKK